MIKNLGRLTRCITGMKVQGQGDREQEMKGVKEELV